MKRLIIYGALIGATLFAPVRRVDVGTLQPVEIVYIIKRNQTVEVRTDTGEFGKGENIGEAVNDLLSTAQGVVYFETAEFLLVQENCKREAGIMADQLQASVRVCFVQGNPDLKYAKKFLRAHGSFPDLSQFLLGENVPVLQCEK